MAYVGTQLIDKFIGQSEAEQAFQPWWDTTANFLVYGLILLGNIIITSLSISEKKITRLITISTYSIELIQILRSCCYAYCDV